MFKLNASCEISISGDPSEGPKAAIAYARYEQGRTEPVGPPVVKSYECPDAPREILIPWLVGKIIDAADDEAYETMLIGVVCPGGRNLTVLRGSKRISVVNAVNAYKLPNSVKYANGCAKRAADAAASAKEIPAWPAMN